ncbi:MAG TPA: guanylate cyclase [Cyanobacteria bacterium UBA11372]|nr:guanylate cyclase [Cyanobacteria bacterium UBA11372]
MPNLNRLVAKIYGQLPLRTVLIVPFVLQIFAAVGLTGYLSFRNGQQAVNDLVNQLQNEVTSRIEQKLEAYLIVPHQINKTNLDAVSIGLLDLKNFQNTGRHFWKQIQVFQGIGYISYANKKGEFIGVGPEDNENLAKLTIDEVSPKTQWKSYSYATDRHGNRTKIVAKDSYDPRVEAWYKDAVKAGKPVWSQIYQWEGYPEIISISASLPVYNQSGKLIGVLGVDQRLAQISDFLRSLKISRSGKTFILERNGLLVASSSTERPYILVKGEAKRLQASQSRDRSIRYAAQHLQKQTKGLKHIRQPHNYEFYVNGDRMFLKVVPFRDKYGLDWLIAVVVPESDFMERINANTRTTILLCLAALAIAILIGIKTSRWVVQPILRLNIAAKDLAKGEWERTVEIQRSDELGELANSFNKMAQQLQESFVVLENKNADLQRLNQLKDEFLANTSHELRTPLNGMIGIAESMIDGATGQLSELQIKNLLMIAQSGHRLATLVNDILDFSKLKHKNLELQLKPVALREIVDVVLTLSRPLIGKKDVQLINKIPAELPPAQADENRLQQILHNLLGNAIKFTHSGFVEVSAEVISNKTEQLAISNYQLAITISDTGIGIPKDKLDRIFEPFEQADGSTAREYGGTGLGLAITKKLLELHNGQIWAESTFGIGSRFTFTLPICGEGVGESDRSCSSYIQPLYLNLDREKDIEPNLPTLSPSNSHNSQQFKILIVDDEPVNLQVLINHLSLENYAITQAVNGIDALAVIDQGFLPDIILLDVMMPRMTGYEVCQKIREHYTPSQLPILMLTAKNQVSDLVTGLSLGANDYLRKPISKNELIARIKTHLKLSNITQSYSRFVPYQFLEHLNKDSIIDVELGDAVKKEMSVLFCDIRDFSSRSETMTPEDTFKFINAYLSRMEPAIIQNNGFIDKYIGDAIMALFSGSADDAVKAGIMMLQLLEEYNQTRQRPGREPIRIGIGINTGYLMLGTVGGKNRMEGTVISDAVNLASRIEALTKTYRALLLISHHTFMELHHPLDYAMRLIDRVKVKGKSEMVSVFEVFDADPPELKERKLITKAIFEEALVLYYMKKFSQAAELFADCLRQNPMDNVAQIYLERCIISNPIASE